MRGPPSRSEGGQGDACLADHITLSPEDVGREPTVGCPHRTCHRCARTQAWEQFMPSQYVSQGENKPSFESAQRCGAFVLVLVTALPLCHRSCLSALAAALYLGH